MKEYWLLVDSHWVDLERAVNSAIKKGWEPLGGVAVTRSADGLTAPREIYAQALIRPADHKEQEP